MKFKLGDNIRLKVNKELEDVEPGETYTVGCCAKGKLFFIDDGGDSRTLMPGMSPGEAMEVVEEVPSSTGTKFDSGKPDWALVSTSALNEMAKVLSFGAEKYDSDNWRKGMEWRRLISAAYRHLSAFSDGEDTDPETELSHLAHLMCCSMFLLEYQLKGRGEDDRYKE